VEKLEQSPLIEALKKLIQGEDAMLLQVKRTIDVVDKTLHHEKLGPEQSPESDRDKS
jgi:hypothetical protein